MQFWNDKYIETDQSLEVIHKSVRFTTPSSNSFFRAEPIYIKEENEGGNMNNIEQLRQQ